MPIEAQNVHGLSSEFLDGKPVFRQVAATFLEFIGNDRLVAHNAPFDIGFLNAELDRINRPPLENEVVDTLPLARRQRPGQKNSLDILAKAFRVDASKRTKHGALIDAEILAGVYLELRGGSQRTLDVTATQPVKRQRAIVETPVQVQRKRRITRDEFHRHLGFIQGMIDEGKPMIWAEYEAYAEKLKRGKPTDQA